MDINQLKRLYPELANVSEKEFQEVVEKCLEFAKQYSELNPGSLDEVEKNAHRLAIIHFINQAKL